MPGAGDLLAHLTPCPVIVEVAGRDFVIPAMDAVAWVRITSEMNLYGLFPILAGPDATEAVEDALWNGDLTEEELARIALDAISIAADRPWWVCLRLLASVAGAWDVIHVNNAVGRSFAGWLDEVWSRTMAVIDPKTKASWVHQIETAPKGWEQETDFNEEEKAFMAAMRSAQ